MSTTKEVKALLAELRRQLDPDQAAHLEPILRRILDAAKPKTIVEYLRKRKAILERWLRLSFVGLGNYLNNLGGCERMDPRTQKAIIDENCIRMLKSIAYDIQAASGIKVDLEMPLLDGTARRMAAASQSVVTVGPGA